LWASGTSLIGLILGTYLTKPTPSHVLFNFYRTTRPFGWWHPVRKRLPEAVLQDIKKENKRDIIATFFAVPWQVVLFLTGMTIIMRTWVSFSYLFIILIGLSGGLYYFWFRHLSAEVSVEKVPEETELSYDKVD
ncbi:MAG: sodium:solute symporter, partial [Calditrichia bacterium]